MIFWLKYLGRYGVSEINIIPVGQSLFAVVMTLVYAWWSDAVQKRWPPIIFGGVLVVISSTALASTSIDSNIPRRWTFYYLASGHTGISGLIMSWVNELNSHDNEKRAFVVASCNMFAYVFQAWLPLAIFPQVEQPRVLRGTIITAFIGIAIVAFALITLYLQRRDERSAGKARVALRGDEAEEEFLLGVGPKTPLLRGA